MKVRYLLPIGQILRNFTEGNPRKFAVSFAFCGHADVIKYPKTTDVFLRARADFLSFRLQHGSDRKTIGSHLNGLFHPKLHVCTIQTIKQVISQSILYKCINCLPSTTGKQP